jgi:nuclear transport factor 2 (NTF2) superfamily protein
MKSLFMRRQSSRRIHSNEFPRKSPAGNQFRSYGNENWQLDEKGLTIGAELDTEPSVKARFASVAPRRQ